MFANQAEAIRCFEAVFESDAGNAAAMAAGRLPNSALTHELWREILDIAPHNQEAREQLTRAKG